jgi:hypothetical protein
MRSAISGAFSPPLLKYRRWPHESPVTVSRLSGGRARVRVLVRADEEPGRAAESS